MESDYGSLIVGLQQRHRVSETAVFTTLANGLSMLVTRFMETLPSASLPLSRPVLKLDIQPGGWAVESANGGERFDRVLLATPLDTTRRLLARLPCKEA